jgi:hypothetical protein
VIQVLVMETMMMLAKRDLRTVAASLLADHVQTHEIMVEAVVVMVDFLVLLVPDLVQKQM